MESALDNAEAALQRGDYGLCLEVLKPLAKSHPLPGVKGSKIRMLMVTAFMGQGEEQKAISTCRRLLHCKDPQLRQRSKQLLSVLEAPSLQRPENWSIKLPVFELTSFNGKLEKSGRNLKKFSVSPPSPPPPPTGPTKALGLGFTGLVFSLLTGLTIFLSR